jgi:hypothetical protein
MKKNIMYDLAHKETDVFKQMIEKQYVYLLRGWLTNNWSLVTSHALEPTPLSEICLLRIQAYSWPCSKLGDTCFWFMRRVNYEDNYEDLMLFILSVYGSTVILLGLVRFSSYLILYTTGRTPCTVISPSQGRYLHTEQHKQRINAYRHPCLKLDSNPRSQNLSKRREFMP